MTTSVDVVVEASTADDAENAVEDSAVFSAVRDTSQRDMPSWSVSHVEED
jgi:hypothetical protein